jgi:tol-pal system protein YbgF
MQEGRTASIQAGSAADLYSAAITEYARGQYDSAIESFRVFLAQHPRDARVPDARFRLGDAYFTQQRYAEALSEFEAIVRQYPGSPHVRAALFRQGLARLGMGDSAGCQILRDAVSRYPQAAEAAQARETLAARCP